MAVGWTELRGKAPGTGWGQVPRSITKANHSLVRSRQVAGKAEGAHDTLALPLGLGEIPRGGGSERKDSLGMWSMRCL